MSTLPSPVALLPHRPPFLFIDTAVELTDGDAACEGTFEPDALIFTGHFPGNPVVPGVLLLEGMAQTLAYWAHHHHPGHEVLLSGADKARFRRLVRPGERIRYRITVERQLMGEVHARAVAEVDGKRAATALVKGHLTPRA